MATPVRSLVAVTLAATLAACAHKAAAPMDAGGPPPPPPPADMGGSAPPPPMGERDMSALPPGSVRPGSAADFAQNAGDRIYFAYDQYAVTPEAGAVLDHQADWLQRYGTVRVRIEGNADERGTREYNLALSGRRADSIRTYLVQHGVDGGRVTTIGYGKERPIDTSGTEDGMAKNRNGHTAVVGGEG